MKPLYYLTPSLDTADVEKFDKRAIAARSADGTMLGLCIGLSAYICLAIPMLVNQVPPATIHTLCIWLLSGSAILGALSGAYLGWHRENRRLRRFHIK
jgi:hypothetical protein